MTTRFYVPLALAVSLGLTVAATAANLDSPTYPMSPNEQLYADLAKLPAEARQSKLVEEAKKEGKLEFIQTLGGALGRGNTKVFTDAFPFVKVNETNLGTNYAMERLVVEERAEKHITDVTGGDITEISYPLELGFVARYPTPATDDILPQYKGFLDKHHRWVAYAWLEKGISYNSKMVKEADAPKAWEDLCNPKYKGEFSIEPARTRFVSFLQKMMGDKKMDEWLACLAKNEPIIMRGATVRLELMLAGDHAIQGENSFYRGMELLSKRGADKVPFKMVLSAPVMAQPSTCVINRMAPNPHAAALFCDSLLGDKVQQYMWDNFRNPVTMASRFMPKEVDLIPVGPMPADEANRLVAMFQKHLGTQK